MVQSILSELPLQIPGASADRTPSFRVLELIDQLKEIGNAVEALTYLSGDYNEKPALVTRG